MYQLLFLVNLILISLQNESSASHIDFTQLQTKNFLYQVQNLLKHEENQSTQKMTRTQF